MWPRSASSFVRMQPQQWMPRRRPPPLPTHAPVLTDSGASAAQIDAQASAQQQQQPQQQRQRQQAQVQQQQQSIQRPQVHVSAAPPAHAWTRPPPSQQQQQQQHQQRHQQQRHHAQSSGNHGSQSARGSHLHAQHQHHGGHHAHGSAAAAAPHTHRGHGGGSSAPAGSDAKRRRLPHFLNPHAPRDADADAPANSSSAHVAIAAHAHGVNGSPQRKQAWGRPPQRSPSAPAAPAWSAGPPHAVGLGQVGRSSSTFAASLAHASSCSVQPGRSFHASAAASASPVSPPTAGMAGLQFMRGPAFTNLPVDTPVFLADTREKGLQMGEELLSLLRLALDERAILSSKQTDPLPPVALGFDLEWRPNFIAGQAQHPVALLQLALHERVYLFQIIHWALPRGPSHSLSAAERESAARQQLGPGLFDILVDGRILKLGVGIQGDVTKLYTDYHVRLQGGLDLSTYANHRPQDHPVTANNSSSSTDAADPSSSSSSSAVASPPSPPVPDLLRHAAAPPYPRGHWSLARLVEHTLGTALSKNKKVRMSNWSITPLSAVQKKYAALDALVGLMVFRVLHAQHSRTDTHDHALKASMVEDSSKPKGKNVAEGGVIGVEVTVKSVPAARERKSRPVSPARQAQASAAAAAAAGVAGTVNASSPSASPSPSPSLSPPSAQAATASSSSDDFDVDFVMSGPGTAVPASASTPAHVIAVATVQLVAEAESAMEQDPPSTSAREAGADASEPASAAPTTTPTHAAAARRIIEVIDE